ncbi:MAG: archease [Caldiserica bacterium]|nr:archease [Caldisericota bacterium]
MGEFTPVPHTADVSIEVKGKDISDLMETAARGMFSLITDISAIKLEEEMEVKVEGEDYEDLLVRWLNELLYLHSQGYIFAYFRIESLSTNFLQAKVKGEKLKSHHTLNLEIKAATYHNLKITGDPPRATIVFDV